MTPQIIPVVLCGGSGTRLWPHSTAATPKQFLTLFGDHSTFQTAVQRAAAIDGVETILVIANQDHQAHIAAQLAAIGTPARLLLEPHARNSAAAIAAASAHIARTWPEAVAVFLSADHHIPDSAAFAGAVLTGAQAALEDRIVTLGLRPTAPSTAFGYILPEPGDSAVRPVKAFVEKPDAETARRYLRGGYLWNSGTFIARPAVLLEDLAVHAPQVLAAAVAAVDQSLTAGDATTLGAAFAAAPAISIDHAVMEKTARASVVPADFEWSDVGDWRAVLQVSDRDGHGNSLTGAALAIDSQDCIVRAPAGVKLAVIGVRDLAVIVAEDGSILVCDLSQSQTVSRASDHFGADPA
jgi:mannose-1-phosphate guanylyltransferase/mannose-6-phosphate isomerase